MRKESPSGKIAIWVNILASSTFVFSLLMACLTPFAGLAALTALTLRGKDAYAAVTLTFIINQLAGFAFLSYPLDMMTFAWGGALWASALAAAAAARAVAQYSESFLIRASSALVMALLAQQFVIYAASWFLPSGSEAFALTTLLDVAAINALAFAFLACLQMVCARLGFARPLTLVRINSPN